MVEKLKVEGREPGDRLKNYLERMKPTAEQSEAYMKKHNLHNYSELRDAALKFILENKNADVLNLAFHSFDDVERMLRLSGHDLAAAEKQKLNMYAEGAGAFYCRHACGICETSCPEKVPVNTIMRYNHYFENGGSEKYAMEKYAALDREKPDVCSQCDGSCETACPYDLPVKGLLQIAHMNLSLG